MKLKSLHPYLLLAPSLLLLIAIVFYPMAFSLYYSFQNWNLALSPQPLGSVGFANYIRAVKDPTFLTSLNNTLWISVSSTAIQFFLGLVIALFLHKRLPGTGYITALLIMPVTISPMVVGFIFRYLYYKDGLITFLIQSIGLSVPEAGILGNPLTSFWAIIMTDTWQWTPFFAILLLAGLQSIPRETIEAARVDGTPPFWIFWYIQLPHLKFVISIAVMIRFMKAFNLFDIVHVLTRGGPGTATRTLSYNLYYAGLQHFNVGYSSAIAWIMIVIEIILINFYIFIAFRGKEF